MKQIKYPLILIFVTYNLGATLTEEIRNAVSQKKHQRLKKLLLKPETTIKHVIAGIETATLHIEALENTLERRWKLGLFPDCFEAKFIYTQILEYSTIVKILANRVKSLFGKSILHKTNNEQFTDVRFKFAP